MMRLSMALFGTLVILWLLARPASAQSAPRAGSWPSAVVGDHLESHEKAREIALENARDKIVEFLRKQNPPMRSWQPTLFDVEKRIASQGQGGDFTDGTYTFKRWFLKLKDPDLDELRRLDREEYVRQQREQRDLRRGDRLLLTGKGVGAILILLCAVVGYIRLDEFTRRTYSLWLRLGLAALIVGTGVGIWLLK